MGQAFLLKEGFILMAVGMLIVYAFLMVLVGVMSLSRHLQRFSRLLPDDAPAVPRKPTVLAPAADDAVRVAVAIAAARRR